MSAWIEESINLLSDNPVMQGTLVALCTFVLEDPTTLASALLVADGRMAYSTALIGLSLGIGLGDWGLYAVGRVLGPKTVSWGIVSQKRLNRAGSWFERNLVAAVFVSRFIPGLRLPANLAAGITHTSPRRYLPLALLASLVWTFIMLSIISTLGQSVLPVLGAMKWPVSITVIFLLVVLQRHSLRQIDNEVEEIVEDGGATASYFEFWHPVVFYLPVAAYYLWLSIKYRSMTLPTASNPSIYSGGMIRESKSQILDMIPESMAEWFAPHALLEKTSGDEVGELTDRALALMEDRELVFPIVAKPDQGQRGVGVQLVRDRGQLSRYLDSFPEGASVCLQALADYPHEAGILYYRYPGEEHGRIMSITLKDFPQVVGDGEHTLRKLIEKSPRAKMMKQVFYKRHGQELDRVLSAGENFQLVFAGNHKQGCIFRDGIHILTEEMESRIDTIARDIPGFYFGRFDIRFRDMESFQQGEAFTIIEVNGAGAEATHIWDPNAELTDAYRTLFEQFAILFRIGHTNREQGCKPLGPVQFLKDVAEYHRIARRYPMAD